MIAAFESFHNTGGKIWSNHVLLNCTMPSPQKRPRLSRGEESTTHEELIRIEECDQSSAILWNDTRGENACICRAVRCGSSVRIIFLPPSCDKRGTFERRGIVA